MFLILLTTVISFFLRRVVNNWEHDKDKEVRTGPSQRMWFMSNQAAGSSYAKDIRLFALDRWLKEIIASSKKILDDFQNKVCFKRFLIDLFDGFAIF